MDRKASPSVTVIIPSIGRDSLARAVTSVREQRFAGPVELIVVFDLPEDPDRDLPDADIILWTGGGKRGSAARNLGVRRAAGDLIAFLDDDDEWFSSKLEAQVALALRQSSSNVVVSSRHVHHSHGSDSSACPTHIFDGKQSLDHYLFVRRRPGGGRASMYTSSLMCTRELAQEVPWDESLRRHQDWDWLLRASARDDCQVVQAPEPLLRIHLGSLGSISASNDWKSSLAWATGSSSLLSTKARADFLAGQTLRYALGARSLRGAAATISAIVSNKRTPSPSVMAIAIAGLLPRKVIERLMQSI